jgi:type II secretory pathway pseudopilin PulG
MTPRKSAQQASLHEQGFALLMTLIVVTVVISIGLSVLDLSIKQIRLSTNARDSEVAFHAANAGMECARYTRRANSNAMENGGAISPVCFFPASPSPNDVTEIQSTAEGDVYLYEYGFTWGGSATRCSQITTLVASSSATGGGLTINNMTDHVPGFPSATKTCGEGERCTVVSVRGYNKSCGAVDSGNYGIVQREVLLQF